MDKDSLASELLHELKNTCKRNFILFIVTLILLFLTNIAWIYVYTLPAEGYEVIQDSDDNGTNSFIGNDGEIIYGEADN